MRGEHDETTHRTASVLYWLAVFPGEGIAPARRGTPLTLELLGEIQEAIVTQVKNVPTEGLSIDEDAEIVEEAIKDSAESTRLPSRKGWRRGGGGDLGS